MRQDEKLLNDAIIFWTDNLFQQQQEQKFILIEDKQS